MNISDLTIPGITTAGGSVPIDRATDRIQILLAIGDDEACVCHLEAVTGMRQAVISQHLMLLRKAGLVTPNRAGRNIYYRLKNPDSGVSMIKDTARVNWVSNLTS